MTLHRILCGGLAAALSLSTCLAQRNPQRGQIQPQQNPAEVSNDAQQARRGPAPEEKSQITQHRARIGGQEISYAATAANYILKADDGTPKASIFFVAYTKNDVPDLTKRPLSF